MAPPFTLIENLLTKESVNVKRGALATTTLVPAPKAKINTRGVTSETWNCLDCGANTAPGLWTRAEIENWFGLGFDEVPQQIGSDSEVYFVRKRVWEQSGLMGYGGCLCIGCLEKRIGRRLKPKDFPRDHPFNILPGSPRLLSRRGD